MNEIVLRLNRIERRLARLEAAQRAGNGETFALTNVTTDRMLDANSTTIAELADVVGTLINDLSEGKTPKI